MKQITAIAAILLASLAAAGTASAQDHAAKAKIPFGFYVGNKWVPAGEYRMTSDAGNPSAITIRNTDSSVALMASARADERQPGAHTLVFTKYGDQYFLHEILCSSCGMNVAFSDSKQEKLARTREASIAAPTDVYLALK
jgi:hypothetical protein